jgi:hypothetical protein
LRQASVCLHVSRVRFTFTLFLLVVCSWCSSCSCCAGGLFQTACASFTRRGFRNKEHVVCQWSGERGKAEENSRDDLNNSRREPT